MKVSDFEKRKPDNVAFTRMRMQGKEVVRAEGVALDPNGHTMNIKIIWDKKGQAFARWMSTSLPQGDVISDGWKYKRFPKYDLKKAELSHRVTKTTEKMI